VQPGWIHTCGAGEARPVAPVRMHAFVCHLGALAVAARPCRSGIVVDQHLITIEVAGRPATFATAHEGPWREAVRAAIADTGVTPNSARFAVKIEFRVVAPRNANEVWDLDNLIKPTLDAMEGVFGARPFRGLPQPADDRVDRLEASKRAPRPDEVPGATIDVWIIDPP
jgi:hypothetical protein